MGNKCVQCIGKKEHEYDHEKIQRKIDLLPDMEEEDCDDTFDQHDLISQTTYTAPRSINYKAQVNQVKKHDDI